jgi:transposase-like protein
VGKSKYPSELKDAVIAKILNRGGQTVAEVCRQEGVPLSVGGRWYYNRDIVPVMKKPRSSVQWSAEAKLAAVLQSNHLSEEAFGSFLRKEGLHSHQVQAWRADILTALDPVSRKPGLVKDDRDQRIRELEKDLHRKDKALAEASALLILQKKVNLIWGKESGDEK